MSFDELKINDTLALELKVKMSPPFIYSRGKN